MSIRRRRWHTWWINLSDDARQAVDVAVWCLLALLAWSLLLWGLLMMMPK